MAIQDRYDVQGPMMGEGGFSRVFRGEERATGRAVALKILKSAFYDNAEVRERFQREVFAVASLSNPHIVGMYDFNLNDSDVYIAMEYVAGHTLRERLQDKLDLAQRFSIIAQIAEAVGAAHARNVVHRDLKPENIKIVQSPNGALDVKVLDFGMAKLTDLESRLELAPLTKVGICFGTPQYMSPEQIRGKLDDPSIDLFALAIIAYELLAGHRPWDGGDPYEVMRAVLRTAAPPIGTVAGLDVPLADENLTALNVFFRSALSKTRDERPADAAQLVEELERALFGAEGAPAHIAVIARQARRADDTIPVQSLGSLPGIAQSKPVVIDAALADTDRSDPPSAALMVALQQTSAKAGAIRLESSDTAKGVISDSARTLIDGPRVLPRVEEPSMRAAARAEVVRAAKAFSQSRRGGFRGLLVPLLVLALLGGSVGYLMGGTASAQASQIHDFLVGSK